MSTRILLLLIAPCYFACTYSSGENKELSEKLVGEWRNTDLKIEMKSFGNRDTLVTFEVNENSWEKKMNMKPIRTVFNANRTYYSEHINLQDSLVFNPAGKWLIIGDTLHMWDTFPKNEATYHYKLVIKDKGAEFFGIEDCDGDGKADDYYYSRQRKQ